MKIMWKKFNQIFTKLHKGRYIYPTKDLQLANRAFEIAQMKEEDVKDVLSVERDVYFGEVPWTRSAFLMELANPMKNLYLVVREQGKIVAFVGSRIRHEDCHITNIAVLSSHQNIGIATSLIKEVEAFAREMKANKLSLEVRMHNKNAQRLYRKYGFESEKVLKNYYTEVHDDGLRMVYSLERGQK